MMDIKLVDGDAVIDSSGKLETVAGGEAVAQSLSAVLSRQKGSFFWSPEAGLGLVDALGGEESDPENISAKVEDVMYDDPRIDAESIEVSASAIYNGNEKTQLVAASFSTIEGDAAVATVEVDDV